jgi:TfoX/Sxy family transcriptional regulator of competence genes
MAGRRSDAKAIFEACAPDAPDVERRSMFGHPCLFAAGSMFMVLHGERIVLRLAEADRAELLEMPDAEPFAPMGREMREYAAVPRAMLDRPDELDDWVARSYEFARELPPPAPRRRRRPR